MPNKATSFFTTGEVARLAGVTAQYIGRLVGDGVIPSLGRTQRGVWIISDEAGKAFLRARAKR